MIWIGSGVALCLCTRTERHTCILSTVKNAARFAVNVANINTTKSQYAATSVRPERALGASPPP